MLRFTFFRISDSAQGSGDHVAMFKGRNELRSLVRVMAKPVQQLRKSPLRRIDPATPLDRLQSLTVSDVGDLGSLSLGAVVAP